MRSNRIAHILLVATLVCSCRQYVPAGRVFDESEHPPKKWTVLIYMSADNDLESAALQDFNELEAARTGDGNINILVLLDRHPAYDSSNDDWSDTRLYEVVHDDGGANSVMVSKRIACPQLGIGDTGEIELNLANPEVLGYLADFAIESYPADDYALIFWGHGTGWRSDAAFRTENAGTSRALAIDDSSSDFMGIAGANTSVRDKGIALIGFDTCFGALLEIAVEFRESAKWLCGSPGIIPSTGWDYTSLFTEFAATDQTVESFGASIVSQFAGQYANAPEASVSFIDLSAVEPLRAEFESFARAVADSIVSDAELGPVRTLMLDPIDLIHAYTYPCDAFIDIQTLAKKISANAGSITSDPSRLSLIIGTAGRVQECLSATIRSSWSSNPVEGTQLAVHLVPLAAGGVPLTPHHGGYTKGSGDPDQGAFVRMSTGWVPTALAGGTLLDRLFYTVF